MNYKALSRNRSRINGTIINQSNWEEAATTTATRKGGEHDKNLSMNGAKGKGSVAARTRPSAGTLNELLMNERPCTGSGEFQLDFNFQPPPLVHRNLKNRGQC